MTLAGDHVPERLAHGPFAATGICVPGGIVEPDQRALQVPPRRRGRRNEIRRTPALRTRRTKARIGVDPGPLERLADAVEAVADRLLAAALPIPGIDEAGIGNAQQVRNGRQNVEASSAERRGKRAFERRFRVSHELVVGGRDAGHTTGTST